MAEPQGDLDHLGDGLHLVVIASTFFFLVDTGLAFASRIILAIGQ